MPRDDNPTEKNKGLYAVCYLVDKCQVIIKRLGTISLWVFLIEIRVPHDNHQFRRPACSKDIVVLRTRSTIASSLNRIFLPTEMTSENIQLKAGLKKTTNKVGKSPRKTFCFHDFKKQRFTDFEFCSKENNKPPSFNLTRPENVIYLLFYFSLTTQLTPSVPKTFPTLSFLFLFFTKLNVGPVPQGGWNIYDSPPIDVQSQKENKIPNSDFQGKQVLQVWTETLKQKNM